MRRTRLALIVATVLIAGRGIAAPPLPLQSLDGAFGPDTITFDPNSGREWLDVTLSVGYGLDEILDETLPGGTFEDFRLATDDEIADLFVHAGIDVVPNNEFVPQNHAPIVQLTALVGVIGTNGNCGSGCSFSFTQGFTAEPSPFLGLAAVTTLAFFDNDPLLSPSYPQAPIGRVGFANGDGPEGGSSLGAWLVAPESGGAANGLVAIAAVSIASRWSRARYRPTRRTS